MLRLTKPAPSWRLLLSAAASCTPAFALETFQQVNDEYACRFHFAQCGFTVSPSSSCRPRNFDESLWPFRKRVACVGDSITSGQVASDRRDYPEVLQNLLGDDYHVDNLGKCGATVLKKPRTPDWEMFPEPYWVSPQYEQLVARVPWDAVVIAFGTNDFGAVARKDGHRTLAGGGVNWTGCNASAIKGTDGCFFERDLCELLDFVRTLGADGAAPKIVLGVPPPMVSTPGMDAGWYGLNATDFNAARAHLPALLANAPCLGDASIVNLLEEPEQEPPAALVPHCAPDAKDSDTAWCANLCDAQSCDPVHPNDRGNARIAANVARAVTAVVKGESEEGSDAFAEWRREWRGGEGK